MSFKDPPTLQQLARRSLLKDEALTISALPNLPVQLFPPLFKDAFTSRQRKILSLMVAAWPFPVLPVAHPLLDPPPPVLPGPQPPAVGGRLRDWIPKWVAGREEPQGVWAG